MGYYVLKNVCLTALLLTGCTTTQGFSVADTLSVQQLPVSQNRDAVMPEAQTLWASTPSCSVQRTGYGNTRRAWFLETCEFTNPAGASVHQEIPTTVSYYFLEDQLVQINMAFTQYNDAALFKQQVHNASAKLLSDPMPVTAVVNEDSTLSVFNDIASKVHVLQKPE